MKFDVIEREVVSGGAISTKEITLSANAKAFKIIFGQIYPNIIKAIVRELFTNAWDSQKIANNLETPIDIHLPTIFEPWFSIRDYGVGMTPEIIDDVYSRVFESTKDDSNEEAGMFGMGSKTPLGYTDGFTVTSIVEGVLYAYDIFIGSDGTPKISLNAQESTDEPDGVEVSVAVKTEDLDTFREYAELFALHAGTPININRKRFLNKRDILLSGDGWELFKPNSNISNTFHIRMGCVLYEIDSSMITVGIAWSERSKYENICALPLIIDFEIGDFDVTGSREDIIYSVQSITKLKERMLEVNQFISDKAHYEIQNQPNLAASFNLYLQYHELGFIDQNTHVKYKSWDHATFIRNISCKKLGINMMHGRLTKRSKKIANFTNYFNAEMMLSDNVITYIILDDGNTRAPMRRIQNLLNNIKKCFAHGGINYNTRQMYSSYLWVKSKNNKIPTRLKPYLPKNYFVINIADIEPLRIKRERKPKVAIIPSAYQLDISKGRPGFSRYNRNITNNHKYFLEISSHRRFVDSRISIMKSLDILGVDHSEVVLLPPRKMPYVEEFDLQNLVTAAENAKNSIDYNFDTYYHHALQRILRHNGFWSHSFNNPIIQHVIGFNIERENINIGFIDNVNDIVKQKFDAICDIVNVKVERFYNDYPIINHISSYEMRQSPNEILQILIGEK